MDILVDTNVVLDFLLRREPFYADAHSLMEQCAKDEITAYIAFHSIPNIDYILRKVATAEQRRAMLRDVCSILTVVGASHDAVLSAIARNDFSDFEDCLQMYCGLENNVSYIVTNNGKDFANSDIPIVTPTQMLSKLTRGVHSGRF